MEKRSFDYTSFDTFSTTDGPFIRYVLFLARCPMRCIYCHNPETFVQSAYKTMTFEQLKKNYDDERTYFKDRGGITFSGGEPLLWAEQIIEWKKFMNGDVNICIETCGNVSSPFVEPLLDELDSMFCDIKFTNEEDYKKYAHGSLQRTLDFLKLVDKREKLAQNCTIREVVVPTINDNLDYIKKLCDVVLTNFKNIRKIELLPFHDMCTDKYQKYNMPWVLKDIESLDSEVIDDMYVELRKLYPEIEFR